MFQLHLKNPPHWFFPRPSSRWQNWGHTAAVDVTQPRKSNNCATVENSILQHCKLLSKYHKVAPFLASTTCTRKCLQKIFLDSFHESFSKFRCPTTPSLFALGLPIRFQVNNIHEQLGCRHPQSPHQVLCTLSGSGITAVDDKLSWHPKGS